MRNNQLIRSVLRRNLGAAVLGMAVSSMNTIIDAFLMGNLLGPDALSAVNLSMPLNYALVAIQCILASGASLLVSKKLGERKNREADEIFTVSLVSILAVGAILMLLASRIAGPIAGVLCRSGDLADSVREYCRVEILCSTVIMMQIALSSFAQRAGNPKIVLKANSASLVINILMDVVYVRLLNLGIGGAALATGTGALAACAATIPFFMKEKPLHLRLPGIRGLKILTENMGTGVAGALQSVSVSILSFVLNYFIERREGPDGVFVLSVGMNFLSFALFFVMGVQNIYTSMGSMMHGQGDDTGLKMLLRSAMRISVPTTLVIVLIQILIPGPLASAFGARTEAQLAMASYGLRIMSLYSLPLCLLLMMVSDYQVLGYFTLASGASAGMIGMLPLCMWLAEIAMPVPWIWAAMPLSAVLTLLLMLATSEFYRRRASEKLQVFTLMPEDPDPKEIFEGTVALQQGNTESFRNFTEQTVPFFESLKIDRMRSARIRLCMEEMLDYIVRQSRKKNEVADVRIAAAEDEVHILIRDNLPPYNLLAAEDHDTNRRILEAFCPKMDYRYTFMQNVNILEWKLE